MTSPEKIEQRERYVSMVALGAAWAAILFLPVVFLVNLLSWKDADTYAFLFIGIASLFYGIALFSRTVGQALLKWVFSLPMTILPYLYFVHTDFYLRGLNWVFPGYGNQSAGGSMATVVLLFLSAGCCFLTGLTGILCSCVPKKGTAWRTIWMVQNILCCVVCIGIVTAVMILERLFPSYASIFYSG